MDLQEPSLDLGLGFTLDDAAIGGTNENPFGSDSDYSSIVSDGDNGNILFPDSGLYGGNADQSDHSLEDAVPIDQVFSVCHADREPVSGKWKSPVIVTVKKPDVDFSKAIEKVEVPNQHDYALRDKIKSTPDHLSNPDKEISITDVSKAIPRKTLATVSFKVITKPKNIVHEKEEPEDEYEKSHMTKNAIAARENRLKKKKYIQSLESNVELLKSENLQLRKDTTEMSASIVELTDELEYLRSVLSNVQEISSLVKGIRSLPNIGNSKKRGSEDDSVPNVLSKVPRYSKSCSSPFEAFSDSTESGSPGICVHVRGSSLSLELCHRCNQQARAP